MAYVLKIGKRLNKKCKTLVEVSQVYSLTRDISCEGHSTFPEGRVYRDKLLVARVSYNGRVWNPGRTVVLMEAQ